MFFTSMKTLFIKYPNLIQFLPKCLKSNKNWLRSIIEQNTEVFQYVGGDLKKDKEYILSFFEQYHYPFSGLSTLEVKHLSYQEEMKRSKRKRYLLLKYCNHTLKDNMNDFSDLLIAAESEGDYEALNYFPEQFINNLNFWLIIIKKQTSFIFFHKTIQKSSYLKNIKLEEYGLDELDKHELIAFLTSKIEKEQLNKLIFKPLLKANIQKI